jgi:hypothetical protein
MAEREPKGILDIIANYKHLANPFYSLVYRGASGHAPEGKFRLSDRDSTNLARWNALGVASWLVPTSMLATYFANKWWDKKMSDAAHKSSVSRISAIRPTLTPDADLDNISNIIKDPKREVELVKSMVSKTADNPNDSSGAIQNWIKDVSASTLPLFAVPLSMLASKYAVDAIYARQMKKRLEAERVAIRNHQNLVDHEIMKAQGLIKGASDKTSWNPFRALYDPAFKARVDKFRVRDDGRVSAPGAILSAPVLGLLLGSGFVTALAYSYLRKNDKDTGTLDYIRKKSLGHNVMQNTPELGLEQFGVPVDQIVARPGDKKQPGYIDVSAAESAGPISQKQLLDNLEELKPEDLKGNVVEESKKKDALF